MNLSVGLSVIQTLVAYLPPALLPPLLLTEVYFSIFLIILLYHHHQASGHTSIAHLTFVIRDSSTAFT